MFSHASQFEAQHWSIWADFFAPFGYFASHAATHCSTVVPPPPLPDAAPPEVVPPEVVPPDVVPPLPGEPPLVENVPDDPLLLELLDVSSLLEHAVDDATRTKIAAASEIDRTSSF
jgi:hypothetical protein